MGRSPCCEKEHTNKGAWTKEEDERLINYIKLHGEGCWRSLPKAAGNFVHPKKKKKKSFVLFLVLVLDERERDKDCVLRILLICILCRFA